MRKFWAVARMTVLESLRSKFAVVFLALLAACLVTAATRFTGDGTLAGRIRTFLDYSTSLTQLLLGLMTVFLATFVVTRDIRTKTVFTVAAKPLGRVRYVLGRWFGIVLLDAALLALAMGAIYGLAQYLRGLPTAIEQKQAAGAAETESKKPDPDRRAVDNEIFAARAEVWPEPFEVEGFVQKRLDGLTEQEGKEEFFRSRASLRLSRLMQAKGDSAGPSPEQVAKDAADPNVRQKIIETVKAQLRKEIIERLQLVGPRRTLRLNFKGVSVRRSDNKAAVQLRYRLHPLRRPDSGLVKSVWFVSNPEKGLLKGETRDDPTDSASSLDFGPELVTSDERVVVFYNNDPRNPTAVKVKPEEVSILYRVGGFEGNLARAGLLVLLRLTFLAAAGVLFGVFLSFPVAALTCLIVLFLGVMAEFAQDATALPLYENPQVLDYVSHGLSRAAFFLMPALPVASSPADALRDGAYISWLKLATEAGGGTGVRALLAVAIAGLIFRRRELARVQV